jgi:hypothetical protein
MSDLFTFLGAAAVAALSLTGLAVVIDASMDWLEKHGFLKRRGRG